MSGTQGKDKRLFWKKTVSEKKKIAASITTKRSLLALLISVLAAGAVFLIIGITKFSLWGYLAEDAYAVPTEVVSKGLQNPDEMEDIDLINVAQGESIYSNIYRSTEYYVSDEKKEVSAEFPMFSRDGKVLYFLNENIRLITEEWTYLDSFGGMYMTDGVTYNSIGARADTLMIMLVKLNPGYQLAQEMTVKKSEKNIITIPMNSICLFDGAQIVFYTYDDGKLIDHVLPMFEDDEISLGGQDMPYKDFLKKIGEYRGSDEPETEIPTETAPEESAHFTPTDGGETVAPESEDESTETIEKSSKETQNPPTHEPRTEDPTGELPETVPEITAETVPPVTRPSRETREETTSDETEKVEYVAPIVNFSDITPWIYIIDVSVKVEDPQNHITNSGITITAKPDGTGNSIRVSLGGGGKGIYTLGQTLTDTWYTLTATYTFTNAQNKPENVKVELGRVKTLGFSEAGTIALDFYDENSVPIGSPQVPVYANQLALCDLVFKNISSGIRLSEKNDDTKLNVNYRSIENYVYKFEIVCSDVEDRKVTKLNLSTSSLSALKKGFIVDEATTNSKLSGGRCVNYEIHLYDQEGNEFTISGKTTGYGHTTSEEPTAAIALIENTLERTGITVTFKNPDNVVVGPNPTTGSYLDGVSLPGETVEATAALFIVPYGQKAEPANAISVKAVSPDGSVTYEGKFLPIKATQEAENDKTTWIITSLDSFTNYYAAVICGSYDILDGKNHYDQNIGSAYKFLTGSFNLGTIALAFNVEAESRKADVGVRLENGGINEQLIPYLNYMNLRVQSGTDSKDGKDYIIRKSLLVPDTATGYAGIPIDYTQAVYDDIKMVYDLPIRLPMIVQSQGEGGTTVERTVYTQISLTYTEVPTVEVEGVEKPIDNVWDYLINTYKLSNTATCHVTFHLGTDLTDKDGIPTGETLQKMLPNTQYDLYLSTYALQGTVFYNVTNTKKFHAQIYTKSEQATVDFTDAFIGETFINLYQLFVTDIDGVIMKPSSSENDEIAVRVVEANTKLEAYRTYIKPNELHPFMVIDGLEPDTDYILYFEAQLYKNQGNIFQNYQIQYLEPQDRRYPAVYSFTTGHGISADFHLQTISMQYKDTRGNISERLSILTEDDFYIGALVYDDWLRIYVPSGTDTSVPIAEAKAQAAAVESENGSTVVKFVQDHITTMTNNSTWWATKMIPVTPGEKYVLYNSDPADIYITFYTKTGEKIATYSGDIRYNDSETFSGSVFQIPSLDTSVTRALDATVAARFRQNTDDIAYMRISGGSATTRRSMILEKFNDSIMASQQNLLKKYNVQFIEKGYLKTSDGVTYQADKTSAYTSTYIPVEGGNIYLLEHRDPNVPDYKGLTPLNTLVTSNSVYFYAEDYSYLGSYTVVAQQGLVKAPYGAKYCRFNVHMDQTGSEPVLNVSETSMKIYKTAISDAYTATFSLSITDSNDLDEQLLVDTENGGFGKYRISYYISDEVARDSDDLSKLNYYDFGTPITVDVTAEDFLDGKLNIHTTTTNSNLRKERVYKATLEVLPVNNGWSSGYVLVDTVYFTTNRVTYTISSIADLMTMRLDPAGYYIVTKDLIRSSLAEELGISADEIANEALGSEVLPENRPFTGTIDFQGHAIEIVGQIAPFYKISNVGTVQNVIVYYHPTWGGASWPSSSIGCITRYNYGVIQDVIIHYNPHSNLWNEDARYSAGIAYSNMGMIRRFVVEIQNDIRVGLDFGGVASFNSGTIQEGYVYADTITEQATGISRTARLIHTYYMYYNPNNGYTDYETTAEYVGGICGYNYSRGRIANVYAIVDVQLEQYTTTNEDLTTTDHVRNSHLFATGVGRNDGKIEGMFVVGDRYISQYNQSSRGADFMLGRGPAVTYIGGLRSVKNLYYISAANSAYTTSTTDTTIGTYNKKTKKESLKDYMWYESILGDNGTAFNINNMVEIYNQYPKVILSDYFVWNDQPVIKLPSANEVNLSLVNNTVYLQGADEALVSVAMYFKNLSAKVTGFTIVDREGEPLEVEVLNQYKGNANLYYVDIKIKPSEDNVAEDSYTITQISYTGGMQLVNESAGTARIVEASFWRSIGSVQAWKDYFSSKTNSITGNYILTADLDFSNSTTYKDWYVGQTFLGVLDGAVYADRYVPMTNSLGEILTEKDEVSGELTQRTIKIRGEKVSMHTISGIGNQLNGEFCAGRNAGATECLMKNMYGTAKNIIFRNFVSLPQNEKDTSSASINSNNAVFINLTYGSVVENCHVRDCIFYGNAYTAGLTCYSVGGTVRLSSVGDTKIIVNRNGNATDSVRAGGLGAYMESSIVEGCFVSNISITASNVYYNHGIGGLIGDCVHTTVTDCYGTGIVSGNCNRLGGMIGYLRGDQSVLSGCWTTVDVRTNSDFAGGLVGYHENGIMKNNYVAGKVVSQSLSAVYTHRITHTGKYNEAVRFNNYAFDKQMISYIDSTQDNPYQFGTWDDMDGANGLLSADRLKQASVWRSVIQVGDLWDLQNTGATSVTEYTLGTSVITIPENQRISGSTAATQLSDGFMPKIYDPDTGVLLYDQPDQRSNSENRFVVVERNKINVDERLDKFTANLAIFYSDQTEKKTALIDFEEDKEAGQLIIDWNQTDITGATVYPSELKLIDDKYDISGSYKNGRPFNITAYYGLAMKDDVTVKLGNYLDSYLLTLTVTDPEDPSYTELVVIRLNTGYVYKNIANVQQWDDFFSVQDYVYDNIKITGRVDFGHDTEGVNTTKHVTNVKVNRLVAEAGNKNACLCNFNLGGQQPLRITGESLITLVVSSVENLTFENIIIMSPNESGFVGGDYKGIIGYNMGTSKNLTFHNIYVNGSSSNYVGCFGRIGAPAENITLTNIYIAGRNTYIGALAGQADSAAMMTNIVLDTDGNSWQQVSYNDSKGYMKEVQYLERKAGSKNYIQGWTYVGGIVGYCYGNGQTIRVRNTEVTGLLRVGGVAGYTTGDGGDSGSYKFTDVVIGDPDQLMNVYLNPSNSDKYYQDEPGVIHTYSQNNDNRELQHMANVIVTGSNFGYAGSQRYDIGGCVGYSESNRFQDVHIYNALIRMKGETTNAGGKDEYMGGLVGRQGYFYNSTADHITVLSKYGYCGGMGGRIYGTDNVITNSVVYTTYNPSDNDLTYEGRYVGGYAAFGGSSRCRVEHCVVAGNERVGGFYGELSGSAGYENVASDVVVYGKNYVGGFIGLHLYDYSFYSGVTASIASDGTPNVSTKISSVIFLEGQDQRNDYGLYKALWNESGSDLNNRPSTNRVYTGTQVFGTNYVGGYAGGFIGYGMHDHFVSSGVTITGTKDVGGLCGTYCGWCTDNNGYNRYCYNCIVSTNINVPSVPGSANVGGIYGRYYCGDTSLFAGITNWQNNVTRGYIFPLQSSHYSMLFTGNITVAETTTDVHFMVGKYATNVYEQSSIDVNKLEAGKDTGEAITEALKGGLGAVGDYVFGFRDCHVYEGSVLKIGTGDGAAKTLRQRYMEGEYDVWAYYDDVIRLTYGTKTDKSIGYDNAGIRGDKDNDSWHDLRTWHYITIATAEDLTDEGFYYDARDTYSMGMAFSRQYWSAQLLRSMYKEVEGVRADTATYTQAIQDGLKQESGQTAAPKLVTWFDSLNNTGEGYTDESAITWTNLADPTNNATLFWNYKTGTETNTYGERHTIMYWDDGALRFRSDRGGYYAELTNSISELLAVNNDTKQGYTVEIVFTLNCDKLNYAVGYRMPFYWIDSSIVGGFGSSYEVNRTDDLGLLSYRKNDAGTDRVAYWLGAGSISGTSAEKQQVIRTADRYYYRTMTYSVTWNEEKSQWQICTYVNGVLSSQLINGSTTYVPQMFNLNKDGTLSETVAWRIGNGSCHSANYMDICSVRIYDQGLTEAQAKQNNAYDMWYYFGEELDTSDTGIMARLGKNVGDEIGITPELTIDETTYEITVNGTSPAVTLTADDKLKLFRSLDGNYNGTLITDEYVSGMKLYDRGYFYVVDAQGRYSNVLTVNNGIYTPVLNTSNYFISGEAYGTTGRTRVAGQEGAYTNVTTAGYKKIGTGRNAYYEFDVEQIFKSTDDLLIEGGNRAVSASAADHYGIVLSEQVRQKEVNSYVNKLDFEEVYLNKITGAKVHKAHLVSNSISTNVISGRRSLYGLDADEETSNSFSIGDDIIVYASDVDKLNIELSKDAPKGMTFWFNINGEDTEESLLLEGQRTITISYDFLTPFSFYYSIGYGAPRGFYVEPDNVSHKVMTVGKTICFADSGNGAYIDYQNNGVDKTVLNMMNGKILYSDGFIEKLETSEKYFFEVEPFTVLDTKAFWSGTISGNYVDSYGTYMVSENGEFRDTQMVMKSGIVYTMPTSAVKPGSFIVDSYGGNVYTTVLTKRGYLSDLGTPLQYPKNFVNSGIVEISNNLASSDHTVMVRYESGLIRIFDYLTGEDKSYKGEMHSSSQSSAGGSTGNNSIISYIAQKISDIFNPDQNDDENDLPSQEDSGIKDELENNDELEDLLDHFDDIVEKEDPKKDTPTIPEETVTEETQGSSAAEEPTKETRESEDETKESEDGSEDVTKDSEEETKESKKEETKASTEGETAETKDETKAPEKKDGSDDDTNKYISVYNKKTGQMEVYTLDEYLNLSEDDLLSEEEKLEILKGLGYGIDNIRNKGNKDDQNLGWALWIAAVVGIGVLLTILTVMKKKTTDTEEAQKKRQNRWNENRKRKRRKLQ